MRVCSCYCVRASVLVQVLVQACFSELASNFSRRAIRGPFGKNMIAATTSRGRCLGLASGSSVKPLPASVTRGVELVNEVGCLIFFGKPRYISQMILLGELALPILSIPLHNAFRETLAHALHSTDTPALARKLNQATPNPVACQHTSHGQQAKLGILGFCTRLTIQRVTGYNRSIYQMDCTMLSRVVCCFPKTPT